MAKTPATKLTIATAGPVSSAKTGRGYVGLAGRSQPKAKLAVVGNRADSTIGGHLCGDTDRINSQLEARMGRQHNVKFRPRGAALAEEVFQAHWYGEEVDFVSEEDSSSKNTSDEDYQWMYQTSLDLETTIELQERLQAQIRKFEYAYDKMCLAALRWHQLMEDVHDDDQVRKMFLDLQMIRRLSGIEYE
jgi:hypothetical protein